MLGGSPADVRARVSRPGLWCAACVAAGIAIERAAATHAPLLWMLLALGCCALAWTSPLRRAPVALCVGALAAGAGWFALRVHHIPANSLARLLTDQPTLIVAEGTLADDPAPHERRGRLSVFSFETPSTRLELRAERVRNADGTWRDVSGALLVRVEGALAADAPLRAGDRVRITGWAVAIDPPENPGQPDPRAWAAQRNVAGRVAVASRTLIERAPPNDAPLPSIHARLMRAHADLRAAAVASLARLGGAHADPASPRGRALLAAILLGEHDDAFPELSDAFTRIGLAHVLAVSGLHLGIAAMMALTLLRAVGSGAARWEAPLVAMLVVLYLLVVPVRTPIVRAAIMTLVFLGAESAGRRYDRLNVLGWAMALTLLWKPLDLWSAGFQLSYLCVGALIWLTPRVRAAWFGAPQSPDTIRWPRRAIERIKDGLAASVVAWAVATPCVAYWFGVVAPLGAPLSLIGVPVAAAALALGYVSMVVTALLPGAVHALAPALNALADAAVRAAIAVDGAPLATINAPPIGAPLAAAITVAVALWLRAGSLQRRAWPLHALTLAVGAWLAMAWTAPPLPRAVALRVDMLSVGDGTCALLRSGRDAVLWDCGSSRLTMGERDIPRALRALGVRRLRAVVISHPDMDHYACAADVATRMGARELIVGDALLDEAAQRPRGAVAQTLADLAHMRIITPRAQDTLTIGDAAADVLWPRPRSPDDPPRASNDESIVLRVRVPTDRGERALLLTGDAERIAMRALLHSDADLRAHALELPHHGSAAHLADTLALLRAADPLVVLQSTGPSRVDDERWDPARPGRAWWETARDGAAFVEFHRDGSIRTGALRRGARTINADERDARPMPAAR